ncbi:MAG: hypothetical protein ABGX36_03870 [Cycloclasticus sp.]|jgi:hypothetical protein|nr:hypothetical protein [Gammaproteobacteria bacterium]
MNLRARLFLSVFFLFSINCHAFELHEKTFERSFIIDEKHLSTAKNLDQFLLNEGFSTQISTSHSTNLYFDTPDQSLAKKGDYLRLVTLKAASTKTGVDETLQYSNSNGSFYSMSVKHYRAAKTLEGKHPLISLIKRKERPMFKQLLVSDGVGYPLTLRAFSRVVKASYKYQLDLGGESVATVIVNNVKSIAFNSVFEFKTISIESNNMMSSESKLADLTQHLFDTFGIAGETIFDNEYTLVHSHLTRHLVFFDWLLKYPFTSNLWRSLLFGLFGGMIVLYILKRRDKSTRLH